METRHAASVEDWPLDIYACQTQLIWANEREVEPHFLNIKTVSSGLPVCWLIQRGHVRIEERHGIVEARSGQWIFLSSSEGVQHFSPRAKLISIHFELNLRGGDPVFARRRTRVLNALDYPELEMAAHEVVALFQRWNRTGTLRFARGSIPLRENFRIEAAFYKWLSVYTETMLRTGAQIRPPKERDARVEKALRMLENHPMREKFSETTLARESGLSVNQLARLFKRDTGLSPFAYYERRRLSMAQHALEATAMAVKEIAFELGFSSSSHFTNWFKRTKKHSPRSYRQKYALPEKQ